MDCELRVSVRCWTGGLFRSTSSLRALLNGHGCERFVEQIAEIHGLPDQGRLALLQNLPDARRRRTQIERQIDATRFEDRQNADQKIGLRSARMATMVSGSNTLALQVLLPYCSARALSSA